ncbi:branched-chain amino acid transaminase [Solidesulfovibrio sp.]|jgi:branched-chain amino acid aminotransferase|uniref:branched-chain amino acid transaminase n=1 Tax=Solidesulfovibrio sp. TaxID=2910990 RepID=UPI000ECFE4DA|nr:branched-chain amino acid transaminase [Solidesulfovibrio sp.]MEA5090627.1 branched-chain amino acid transaminase [Solidesulfovibrio sp.]HCR14047.1 branched chain amino acid aminotransferase [Desulfovibrio sp.]HML61701.1 branched-chain amino acid transaminase [Solidesulfovibrio sp.]
MGLRTDFIWMDGTLTPWDQANVHVLTHGLHYGYAVFEGIRAYECVDGSSAVFRLKEHVDRLFGSAKILGLAIPFTPEQVATACVETLVANKMRAGYIRPLVFVGSGSMGVNPADNPIRVAIAVWPWGAYLGAEALEKGISIRTSSYTRFHVNSMMSKAKSAGNYVNSVLAKTEALADGYDEAMMLDASGYVAEGSGENIYIVKNGVIKTPPLTTVLAGITRDSVIALAKEMGYEVVEQFFTRDEVYVADEAFFTGTAAELTPIRALDRRVIGEGHAGPVAKALQKAFFKVVKGENPKYAGWLHRYSL